MKTDHCFKEFMRYVTLNVLGMLGLSCYILADTFFVSKALGANGLAALNLAIPVYSFINGNGLMLGVGGAAKYSITRSQKDVIRSNGVFTNTLYASTALSVILMLAGMFLSEKITVLLGADPDIFRMTNTYLMVILLFAPAFIMNDVFICFVRNDGNPKLAMLAMLTGSLSNILLDYIFMFPLSMGISGAVLATGLAPIISIGILTGHLKQKDHFHIIKIRPNPVLAGTILSLGLPSFITEAASGIVMIIFNSIILNMRGNVGVAAYSVIANLSLVVVSIYTGIAQGMQPLVSRAYGYNKPKQIKQLLHNALAVMFIISAAVYLCFFVLADPIVAVFNSENQPELRDIAAGGLKLYFSAIPFAGFNMVVSMFFTAVEMPVPAQVISVLRGLVLMAPMAFLLSGAAGLTGVWLTFPVTELIVAALGIIFYFRITRSGSHSTFCHFY